MAFDALLFAKGLVLLGLGSWLLLAAINNFVDPDTNITLLKKMMTMQAIKTDNDLGIGLLPRALTKTSFIPHFLKITAMFQILIAGLLLSAAVLLMSVLIGVVDHTLPQAIAIANIAVTAFMSLWLFFTIGGLWFGYWIKMGMVQIVHFILLVVSILTLILLNLPSLSVSS